MRGALSGPAAVVATTNDAPWRPLSLPAWGAPIASSQRAAATEQASLVGGSAVKRPSESLRAFEASDLSRLNHEGDR